MSVHLFNAVIDVVLAQLDPELGTEVGGVQVNHGTFANDIVLYAVMPAGLQALADDLNHQLLLCGLEISTGLTGKSASLRIDVDGRAKKWVVNPLPHLRVVGELIPAVSISQVYRYLGVEISPQSTRANVAKMLEDGLLNILAAPLKPQQRLYIASCILLPSLYHQLTLSPTSDKYLVEVAS